MNMPKITRPIFPAGYVDNPKSLLNWDTVQNQLAAAKNYWLGSVRPNGQPHTVPKWAVWVNDRIYFDGSPQTRHARNIAQNPHVTLHLESGDEAVIIEGIARTVKSPAAALATAIAQAYTAKYAAFGYAPEPTQWDEGGLFEIIPRTILAWTSFADDPTKFLFE